MEQEDFMLTLYDRLNVIRDTINKYGEDKFYLSFSGGKDSTALHYLIDEALPGNTIPRVFINTGIEYTDIFKFVKEMSEKDDRFEMITVGKHIKHTLDERGYPFKSKEHSNKLSIYQHIGNDSKTVARYLDKNNTFGCTDKLRYQFEPDFDIKISDYCCKEFKKYPARRYERRTGRSPILGLRRQEGGQRKSHSGCILVKDGKVERFNPLNPVSDEFVDWYIQQRGIKLCKLYYPPYNFIRTGCSGCPYNRKLRYDLAVMKELLPIDYHRSEYIWKPIYDEYRRIGYRLKD